MEIAHSINYGFIKISDEILRLSQINYFEQKKCIVM